MDKLIIIGGYGNGTVAASTVEDINKRERKWEIIGFLNDFEKKINDYPVIGPIHHETVQKWLNERNTYFLYTLISAKYRETHIDKLLELKIPEERFATIIHPTAVISKFSSIGQGVSIQPFVSVGPNVKIANHVQIFAQSLIGHNAKLDNYTYVANNACIGANVHLQEGAYLGTNCTTIENITLGRWCLVGIGAVVIKDVPPYTKVVGNPAREIGKTR